MGRSRMSTDIGATAEATVGPIRGNVHKAGPIGDLAARKQVKIGTPRFGSDDGFWHGVRSKVDEYFRQSGISERDAPAMYLKSFLVLAVWMGLYTGLVFAPLAWWLAIPMAGLLGLTCAAIGFNIAHDGGHKSYSRHRWINRISAATMDLVGGSSVQWRYKHGVLHHQFVNLTGFDTDIDIGILGRLSPHQRHRSFHRWQHLYMWPLYGFLAFKWHLVDDFKDAAMGYLGHSTAPRLKPRDLAGMLVGKLVFFGVVFVVPAMLHPIWVVVAIYTVASMVQGFVLSLVFQLAHAVEGAAFPAIPEDRRMDVGWAVHQIRTTTDYCRGNRLLTWLLGGLNYQIEHHLFPQIGHVHYPAVSQVVEQACREHGIPYRVHPTFRAGVIAHYRWLRQMGMAT